MSQKRIHLRWLQQTLLTKLYSREMFGLEIQRDLKLWGEDVGAGQLYPALKKLEKAELITSQQWTERSLRIISLTAKGQEIAQEMQKIITR